MRKRALRSKGLRRDALLDDVPVLKHHDLVGTHDRAHAVRNHEHGPSPFNRRL
jgi:hypothetical protein